MNKLLAVKKILPLSVSMVLALGILLSTAGSVVFQDESVAASTTVAAAPSQRRDPTDPAEVEAFLDTLLRREMEEHRIAGAAVSVVKDGELLLAKGYGYADVEKRIPVDPEQTGFLIGSVSKLFTWTAVMQLVEQGMLDLDVDINSYLDFAIPDTYPQPITLRHLLTHTDGFEELWFEVLASEGEKPAPWREWMVSHMPARVRPPGETAAYSNYGTALAAYVVTQVSKQSFGQYVQEHILNPLGMAYTSAQWPFPPDLNARRTTGYTYENGAFQVFPYYKGSQWVLLPAGGIQASAADMARFMIAHLPGGGNADTAEARILQDATLRQMHSRLFTHDPRLLGTAYGFFDFSHNGQRIIGHSGEADPNHTLLLLAPDQNLGVFVSYNSVGGAELTNQHLGFERAFFDHYYAAPAVEPIQPPANFAERAGRFAGSYIFTKRSYTTLEKFMGLLGDGTVEISDSGDGTLLLSSPWGNWRFAEVAPLYFRQIDAPYGIVFREDDRGRITHMFLDYTPMWAWEKLKWYETSGFNMALLLGCVFIFLSMIPVLSIGSIRKRRRSG
jgi:CubicO group peptidase (beta-lactamase class C family)